jgi:hypothetical protein
MRWSGLGASQRRLRVIEVDPTGWLALGDFQLEDVVSFVDVVTGDGNPAPVLRTGSVPTVSERTSTHSATEAPVMTQLHEVGSLRFH